MLITDNSPTAGYIAWTGVEITRTGITYTPTNGNSNKKFIWWDFSSPTTLQTSDTMPALAENDALIFINDTGTHYTIPIQTAIHGASIIDGTIEPSAAGTPVVSQFLIPILVVLASDTTTDYIFYPPEDIVITEVFVAVEVAPTGQSLIVDIHKNGTTIFTTQSRRPTILAGTTTATSGVVEVTSAIKNDVITAIIDQIGSGTTGENLLIFIRYKQA